MIFSLCGRGAADGQGVKNESRAVCLPFGEGRWPGFFDVTCDGVMV